MLIKGKVNPGIFLIIKRCCIIAAKALPIIMYKQFIQENPNKANTAIPTNPGLNPYNPLLILCFGKRNKIAIRLPAKTAKLNEKAHSQALIHKLRKVKTPVQTCSINTICEIDLKKILIPCNKLS